MAQIKTCGCCGFTKELAENRTTCPNCNQISLGFFIDFEHLVGYINLHGLKGITIQDDHLKRKILAAFNV